MTKQIPSQYPELEDGQICPTASEASSGYLICNDQRVIEVVFEPSGHVSRTTHFPNPVGTKNRERLYEGLVSIYDESREPHIVDVSGIATAFPLQKGASLSTERHYSGAKQGYVEIEQFEVLKAGKLTIGMCQYKGLEIDKALSSNRDPRVGHLRLFYVPDLKYAFIKGTARMQMADNFIHPLSSKQKMLNFIRAVHVARWGA